MSLVNGPTLWEQPVKTQRRHVITHEHRTELDAAEGRVAEHTLLTHLLGAMDAANVIVLTDVMRTAVRAAVQDRLRAIEEYEAGPRDPLKDFERDYKALDVIDRAADHLALDEAPEMLDHLLGLQERLESIIKKMRNDLGGD